MKRPILKTFIILFVLVCYAGCASKKIHHNHTPSTEKQNEEPISDEELEAYSTSEDLTQINKEAGGVNEETRHYLEHVAGASSRSIHDFKLRYFPSMYKGWVKYFSQKGRERFIRHMKNGQEQFLIVKKILEEYGVPPELFFVGLIESGYHMKAKSHASAVGPWQFIKGTARRYGLRVNKNIDDRVDIVKSTQAAASYFRDLYNIFGSWELALCAYNAGEYGIIRAIKKGNTRDYVELVRRKLIPAETANYVPKVAAAWELIMNPQVYNLPNLALNLKSPLAPDKQFNKQIEKQEFEGPNNKKVLVAEDQKSLPEEGGALGQNLIEVTKNARPKNRGSKITKKNEILAGKSIGHKVKKGEGLSTIAKKYDLSIPKIAALNKLKGAHIKAGQLLKLPLKLKGYVVKKGDNLKDIAEKFNTSIVRIVNHNALKSHTIYPRQKIYIPLAYDL